MKQNVKKIFKSHHKSKNKKAEYIVAVVFNIFFLIIIFNISKLNLSFIKNSFVACLWAIKLAIYANIVGNLLLFIYDDHWFKKLIKFLINIPGFISLLVVYTIFPFDFTEIGLGFLNTLSRIGMLIGLIVIPIVMVVQIIGVFVELIILQNCDEK